MLHSVTVYLRAPPETWARTRGRALAGLVVLILSLALANCAVDEDELSLRRGAQSGDIPVGDDSTASGLPDIPVGDDSTASGLPDIPVGDDSTASGLPDLVVSDIRLVAIGRPDITTYCGTRPLDTGGDGKFIPVGEVNYNLYESFEIGYTVQNIGAGELDLSTGRQVPTEAWISATTTNHPELRLGTAYSSFLGPGDEGEQYGILGPGEVLVSERTWRFSLWDLFETPPPRDFQGDFAVTVRLNWDQGGPESAGGPYVTGPNATIEHEESDYENNGSSAAFTWVACS